jgi:phosphonate transport system substrate-binding protein
MFVKKAARGASHIDTSSYRRLAMPTRSRRWFLAAACVAAGAGAVGAQATAWPLRIGLTPVFLDDQLSFLNDWRGYLQARLQRPVQFVQRASYRDIVGLLQQGQLDFAWVCGYPFVRNARAMRLLAVPLYQGQPLYRSYLIVPATDGATRSLLDLRAKVFAFSDRDSNSGHLYTLYSLLTRREPPATFFARSFFTGAHRKVVDAVSVGLAHGGAVDGYVWDTLALRHPGLTGRTRIVERSPEFGFPPFVAGASVSAEDFEAMQSVLMRMRADSDGQALLSRLNLDGFVPGSLALFDGVRAMSQLVDTS